MIVVGGLTDAPAAIFQRTEIKILKLRDTFLTSCPPAVAQLTNLEKLIIRGAHLGSPSWGGVMTSNDVMLLFCGGCGRELMLWATVSGWVCHARWRAVSSWCLQQRTELMHSRLPCVTQRRYRTKSVS